MLIAFAYLCLFIPTMVCGGEDLSVAVSSKGTENLDGGQKVTLRTSYKNEWRIDILSSRYIYYIYNRCDELSNTREIANVFKIDLTNPKYKLELAYFDKAQMLTLSTAAKKSKWIIDGINGGYEPEAIYQTRWYFEKMTLMLW